MSRGIGVTLIGDEDTADIESRALERWKNEGGATMAVPRSPNVETVDPSGACQIDCR
jgi:hypothetical protein